MLVHTVLPSVMIALQGERDSSLHLNMLHPWLPHVIKLFGNVRGPNVVVLHSRKARLVQLALERELLVHIWLERSHGHTAQHTHSLLSAMSTLSEAYIKAFVLRCSSSVTTKIHIYAAHICICDARMLLRVGIALAVCLFLRLVLCFVVYSWMLVLICSECPWTPGSLVITPCCTCCFMHVPHVEICVEICLSDLFWPRRRSVYRGVGLLALIQPGQA